MVLILKDKLSEVFLGWYFGEKRTCPPLKSENNFLAKSAKELANLIETKQITSTQLIKATIDRMNEVNGVLNAIVDGPFVAEALREAQLIDERIANNQISKGYIAIKIYIFFYFSNFNYLYTYNFR